MTRPRLAQLHQSGAADGEVPVWDDTAGMWVPGPGAGVDRASDLTTAYMPLVSLVAGVPTIVLDADDSLIPTEIPL